MSTSTDPINKISRPRLSTVFERERVFRLLNDARRHSVIWISAPAGAGKTTLVASYLESLHHHCVWYQIDHRDADPATLFYYLSLAVKRATPRKRKPIPLLKPEFMPGIDAFALSFFEAVYQRLPKPVILVMDNYQQINPKSINHGLISSGLSILPQRVIAIVISREHPPANFSRMLANREMVHIGWNQIRLTLEETAGIVRLQKDNQSISKTNIRQLHKAAGGWTAGLMLMLAKAHLDDIDWQWVQGSTPEEILDYFAKEVFENETSEIQDFLLRAAVLPHMTTSMAKTFTGHPRAGQILAELSRNNRFTERRLRHRLFYQFHPLFREFLLSRTKLKRTEEELADWRLKAAKLLIEEGNPDSAAELLQDAQAWDALIELIMNHALIMIRQGRNQSLLQWLRAVPKAMVAEMPWLQFWMGIAQTPFDPEAARAFLEKAFNAFQNQNDTFGLFFSWSFIIRAIFLKMTDISPFDHWIQILDELMDKYGQLPNREIEGQVVAGMLLALVHRQMNYPNIELWVNRGLSLLSEPLDSNTKVSISNNTLHYYLLTGNYGKAAQIMDLQRPSSLGPRMDSNDTIAVVAHLTCSAFYYCYIGMHENCIDVVNKGLEIAKKTGFIILNNIIAGHGIWSALINEEYATARALFEKNADSIKNAKLLDQGLINFVKSLEALSVGKLSQAAAHSVSALNASLDVGSQFSTIFCHLLNARVNYETGEHQAAEEHLNKAIHLSKMTRTKHLMFHSLMLKARFALNQEHREAGLQVLRKSLALGKEIGLYHNMIESRSNLAWLCAIALEHGIEENYVSTYIRKRSLTLDTPPIKVKNWPWPLKISTLGRFEILCSDRPLKLSAKTPKKPLELLKLLICHRQSGMTRVAAMDFLWPEADGDRAIQNLNTTLHRLRKILGPDEIVVLEGGKLSLNSALCWVDAWYFEDLVNQVKSAPDPMTDVNQLSQASAIYGGHFDGQQEGNATIIAYAEKLKNLWIVSVTDLGTALTQSGKQQHAADLLQEALALDDTAEPFYYSLMNVLSAQGRPAEALFTFNRCRNVMVKLGMEPSEKTTTLYHRLQAARPASGSHLK
jgi:ATP/maltotriose-dependent transcriptional regulator MalT/DNA-binding SARP family transcriptional activator